MKSDEFLLQTPGRQSAFLLEIAKEWLFLLEKYTVPYIVSKRSLQICDEYLNGYFHPAQLVGLYLDHPDPDYFGLTAQFSFVGDDTDAHSALNLVVYATGFIGRQAYLEQGMEYMPDPLMMATADNAVSAISEHEKLLSRKIVSQIP